MEEGAVVAEVEAIILHKERRASDDAKWPRVYDDFAVASLASEPRVFVPLFLAAVAEFSDVAIVDIDGEEL